MVDFRVLYVSHAHPAFQKGGAQVYALELFEAMRERTEVEAYLLSRVPDRVTAGRGTPFTAIDGDSNQVLLSTGSYDPFYGRLHDRRLYTLWLEQLLESLRPDVVHFQHTEQIGFPFLQTLHRCLPDAKIVYTLHEYLPICFAHGKMVRTTDGSLCRRGTPRDCHGCFPEIPTAAFALRERFIRAHLDRVDLFHAPSEFLRERYIEWGIDPDRIEAFENGRPPVTAARTRLPDEDGKRNRFAFFGQITPTKGVDVLLKAAGRWLQEWQRATGDDGGAHHPPFHVSLHVGDLKLLTNDQRREVEQVAEQLDRVVTLVGAYERDELPRLMEAVDWVVVPSTWWENSPLVIQEAFAHGRPVICSGIGGMAERVRDGVDGLHFRAGDALELCSTMKRATDPDLWQRLHDGIQPPMTMADAVDRHISIYRRLLSR